MQYIYIYTITLKYYYYYFILGRRPVEGLTCNCTRTSIYDRGNLYKSNIPIHYIKLLYIRPTITYCRILILLNSRLSPKRKRTSPAIFPSDVCGVYTLAAAYAYMYLLCTRPAQHSLCIGTMCNVRTVHVCA